MLLNEDAIPIPEAVQMLLNENAIPILEVVQMWTAGSSLSAGASPFEALELGILRICCICSGGHWRPR